MGTSSSQKTASQRGISMIIALFIVVMLFLVSLAVLSSTSDSASNVLSIQTKNQTLDTAEAGANVAQWNLDQNSFASNGSGTGTINAYTYTWMIVDNELHGAGKTVSDPNPQISDKINVPAGGALVAGKASSILGGRTVYVEQIVVPGAPTLLAAAAITCGKTGVISHQQITDLSGNHRADIRCGIITSSGGGQVPDGNSYATGTSNAITGYDGIAHTNQPPPTFLTSAQLAAIQSNTLTQSKSGGSNYYTAGNVTGGTIGSSGANCVAYIGGNLTLNGKSTLTNYCATTVVMGDVNIGGNATYSAVPASLTHIMYVFGTTGSTLHGTPSTAMGIFYVANTDVTIDGSGNSDFTGAVITPNNVTMNGGGTGGFKYPGNQTPPPVPNPNVVTEAQWDY